MSVRPDDLANVCALFVELGQREIVCDQLPKLVSSSLPLDAQANAGQIIDEARRCRLLAYRNPKYHLTRTGRRLGTAQSAARSRIADKASRVLIQEVYLNPEAGEVSCAAFLDLFQPDPVVGTFVLDRKTGESIDVHQWLLILSRVGLVRCEESKAYVEKRYLDKVNVILAKFRGSPVEFWAASAAEQKEVGEIAEELALEWESSRLRKQGFPELTPLIRHISKVYQSAGYDIESCRCTSKKPETPIYIEVKGTREKDVRFIWSRNERRVAQRERGKYWIYCFTEIDLRSRSGKGPYRIQDPSHRIRQPEYSVEPLQEEICKVK